ncbi:MAG: hypothetical protein R2909_10155 [Gemmatimonadales bacterium]
MAWWRSAELWRWSRAAPIGLRLEQARGSGASSPSSVCHPHRAAPPALPSTPFRHLHVDSPRSRRGRRDAGSAGRSPRDALRHRDRPIVTLGEELRFARTYLAIIRTRFADRFAYDVDVPDALLDQAVPLFLLQPLIENAVQHGIGERIEGGRVTIRGRERNDRVILEVLDDGAGGREPDPEGIGLGNTCSPTRDGVREAASLELVDGEVGSAARSSSRGARWSRPREASASSWSTTSLRARAVAKLVAATDVARARGRGENGVEALDLIASGAPGPRVARCRCRASLASRW